MSTFQQQAAKVTLRDVGKCIKCLVGDFYHPLYLSKEFQLKLAPEKGEVTGKNATEYHIFAYCLGVTYSNEFPLLSLGFCSCFPTAASVVALIVATIWQVVGEASQ